MSALLDDRALLLIETDTLRHPQRIRHWRSTCSIGWPNPRSIRS
jgi:hypothetical protein